MTEAPSERDRVALVHEAMEVWNTRGLEAFAEERWSADIVWEEASGFPEAGVRHGREACVRRMRERFEALGHVDVEVVNVDVLSDRGVLMELIIRGRGQASGAPTEMRDWFLTEVDEEDKTVRMREFLGRDEAMRAVEELGTTRPGR
jgi:ketosteroid isomerase-like protein